MKPMEYGLKVVETFFTRANGICKSADLFDANKPGDLELLRRIRPEKSSNSCVEVGGCSAGETWRFSGIEKQAT